MSKKCSLDEIKKYFQENNAVFLDNFYDGAKHLHNYICSCGNQSTIRVDNFKSGARCLKCSEKQKPTLEEVKKIFLNNGLIFLDSEYKNAHHLHNFMCTKNHISKIRLLVVKKGHGCSICSKNKKFTIEEVKIMYKEKNCTFLDKNYINSQHQHNYICSCGNKSKTSVSAFRLGRRCIKCSGHEKFTLDQIKKKFEDAGCIFLDDFYQGSSHSHSFKCSCGHISKITYDSIRSGGRCGYCAEYGIKNNDNCHVYLIGKNNKIKIGIMKHNSNRLENHFKNGWHLLDKIANIIGFAAKDIENTILEMIDILNIKTCNKLGIEFFDGYTETWLNNDLNVSSISEIYEVYQNNLK